MEANRCAVVAGPDLDEITGVVREPQAATLGVVGAWLYPSDHRVVDPAGVIDLAVQRRGLPPHE